MQTPLSFNIGVGSAMLTDVDNKFLGYYYYIFKETELGTVSGFVFFWWYPCTPCSCTITEMKAEVYNEVNSIGHQYDHLARPLQDTPACYKHHCGGAISFLIKYIQVLGDGVSQRPLFTSSRMQASGPALWSVIEIQVHLFSNDFKRLFFFRQNNHPQIPDLSSGTPRLPYTQTSGDGCGVGGGGEG